jgi:hypothetical protein
MRTLERSTLPGRVIFVCFSGEAYRIYRDTIAEEVGEQA